jgi:hypothetical protein
VAVRNSAHDLSTTISSEISPAYHFDPQPPPLPAIHARSIRFMQIDGPTIGVAVGSPAALWLLWAALARWWRRCKPTIRVRPGLFEVKWRVDP